MPRLASLAVHSSDGAEPDGLRTQTFAVEYGPCTLIVGPNGAGKTIRGPLGITAALEGLASVPTDPRRPHVGPLPEHTGISLALDDGTSITRDLSSNRGGADKESTQKARDIVGIPPAAWDLSDFTASTPGGRARILDVVARAGGAIESWDRGRAIDEVRDVLRADMPEEDGAGDWWYCALYEADAALPEADAGATWLESARVWAAAQQTERNAQQKASRATATELGQTIPPQVDGDARADDARADDLRDERARAQVVDRTAATRYDAEGVRLHGEVERIGTAGTRRAQPLPVLDPSYQRRVDEAAAALARPAADLRPLEAAHAAAQQAQETAREAVQAARGPVADALAEYTAAEADSSTAAATLRLLQAAATDPHAQCRHCGGADPLGSFDRLGSALAHATETATRQATARAHRDTVQAALTQAEAAYRAAQDVATRAEAELGARRRAQPDRAKLERAVAVARAELAQAQATHTSAAETQKADVKNLRLDYAAAATAYEQWEARPRPAVVEPDPARLAAIAAELVEIAHRQDLRAARVAAIEQLRAAAATADRDWATWRATVALVAAVRAATSTMAAVAYHPIEEAAQRIYAGCPALPLPYFESTDDYGAIVSGEAIPYAGLSQSGALTTAAALVYALAHVARCPVRIVLLDGIEVVTEDQRPAMLRALSDAVRRGDVDSVVCTMASPVGADLSAYQAIEGLTVVEVAPGQHRAPVARPAASTQPEARAPEVAPPARAPIRAGTIPF